VAVSTSIASRQGITRRAPTHVVAATVDGGSRARLATSEWHAKRVRSRPLQSSLRRRVVAEHADGVKYSAGEYVEMSESDLASWRFRAAADGIFEAWGPCPACHGVAFGPRLVDLADRDASKVLVGEDVDVPCECRCGIDHGAGAALGCGRWWISSGKAGG
jgi:hypothetical protein